MIGISTHVLDTAKGRPAPGVRVMLEHLVDDGNWIAVGEGLTDDSGRVAQLLGSRNVLNGGFYRLIFFVAEYFKDQDYFYPQVAVDFLVRDPSTHYHVPLLLSPYGYTTYRGS